MTYLRRNFEQTEALNRQAILGLATRRPGSSLLDIGCGDGAFTQRLATHVDAGHAVGVELVEELAEAARGRGLDVHTADAATRLPFDDGTFDVVHTNQVIEHVAGTDAFMAEIKRVLRPDGYAIISTNNLASLHNILALVAGWQPMPAHVSDVQVGLGNPFNPYRGDPGASGQMHLRLFTGRALRELAALHGLVADAERTAGFYPLPPAAAAIATRLLPRWGAFLVQRYRPR